jgi:hypothetical protein
VKTCVYTYLFGAYDGLIDQPVAAESTADFLCFTDDPTLVSETWTVIVVQPRFAADDVRSARRLKIIGHEALDAYDATLSIDASVLLRQPPEKTIDAWLADADLAVAHHSYREQLLDEFDEVIRLNYDDRARIHEQLIAYSLTDPDALQSRPLWTGMMVRRRTEAVDQAMRLWFDHVLRYSRRDQLSLPIVLAECPVTVRVLELDNFESEFHEWPSIRSRRIAAGKAPSFPAGPALAEARRADRRAAELQAVVDDFDIAARDEAAITIGNLRDQVAQGFEQRVILEERVREGLRESGRWEQRWADTQGLVGASANLARSVKSIFRRR